MSTRGHRTNWRLWARTFPALGVVLGALLLGAGLSTPAARADGDPASDVLVSQSLYLPADAGVSAQELAQLNGVLGAVQRSGTPVRVAVIPSAYDLGSVDALWLKPKTYARFLGVELSLIYKQALLIVMPNGFGLNWPGHSTATADARLSNIRIGAGPRGFAAATEAAVRAVAASDHLPVGSSRPPDGGGGGAVTGKLCLSAVNGFQPPKFGGRMPPLRVCTYPARRCDCGAINCRNSVAIWLFSTASSSFSALAANTPSRIR